MLNLYLQNCTAKRYQWNGANETDVSYIARFCNVEVLVLHDIINQAFVE